MASLFFCKDSSLVVLIRLCASACLWSRVCGCVCACVYCISNALLYVHREASEHFGACLTPFLPALARSDGTKPFADQTDLPPEMKGAIMYSNGEITPSACPTLIAFECVCVCARLCGVCLMCVYLCTLCVCFGHARASACKVLCCTVECVVGLCVCVLIAHRLQVCAWSARFE